MRKGHDIIEIRHSPGKGRGVFAVRPIRKGRVIEIAPYIAINRSEYALLKKTVLINYVFDVGYGSCGIALGTASLFNHGTEPNADYWIKRREKQIEIRADRLIHAGEEITIDYGYNPADLSTWSVELRSYFSKSKRSR